LHYKNIFLYQILKQTFLTTTKFNTNNNAILNFLPFEATPDQASALANIQSFIHSINQDFIMLRGAAGTGKTSIMKAVVDYLKANFMDFELLAPTGNAVKIISKKTNVQANTIHSHIYSVSVNNETGIITFTPKSNQSEAIKIYIVDESSMISDKMDEQETFITTSTQLSQYIHFVKEGNPNNKFIFVGDAYQLAPVGYAIHEQAPALSPEYLLHQYRLRGSVVELNKIMRQLDGSSILKSAHSVRQVISSPIGTRYTNNIGDFVAGDNMLKRYLQYYNPDNHQAVALIAQSNSTVINYNSIIRNKLGYSGSLVTKLF
jgi:exodeoxyribonuclease V